LSSVGILVNARITIIIVNGGRTMCIIDDDSRIDALTNVSNFQPITAGQHRPFASGKIEQTSIAMCLVVTIA
jgi:hypothetical protein